MAVYACVMRAAPTAAIFFRTFFNTKRQILLLPAVPWGLFWPGRRPTVLVSEVSLPGRWEFMEEKVGTVGKLRDRREYTRPSRSQRGCRGARQLVPARPRDPHNRQTLSEHVWEVCARPRSLTCRDFVRCGKAYARFVGFGPNRTKTH